MNAQQILNWYEANKGKCIKLSNAGSYNDEYIYLEDFVRSIKILLAKDAVEDMQPPKAFDPTKPVRTRDGRKARIICVDRKHTTYPLVALTEREEELEYHATYTKDGKFDIDTEIRGGDLVNISEEELS